MLKSVEIKNTLDSKLKEIENLKGEEKKAMFAEIKDLKTDYDMQLEIEAIAKKEIEDKIETGDTEKVEVKDKMEKVNIKNAFAKVIAGKEVTDEERKSIKNVVIEGEKGKGGVAVPTDVSTDIKVYQDATRMFDIRPYITVEPVTVLSGSRPYATNKPQASGFAPVAETAAIQAMYEPTFDSMNYLIQKYAGYIPVSNELLDDSTYGIYNYLVKWLAENELNTYAYQVFNGTGTNSAEGILTEIAKTDHGVLENRVELITSAPDVDKFKSIINVDLETLTTDTIRIFTNSDGYNYLDSLKDAQKRYYMQPDVTGTTKNKRFLDCEVIKVPKKFLPTDTTNGIPFILGDLMQLYTIYDRQVKSVQSTNIGGDAWRNDETEIKGIFRFDGKILPQNVEAIKVLYAKF